MSKTSENVIFALRAKITFSLVFDIFRFRDPSRQLCLVPVCLKVVPFGLKTAPRSQNQKNLLKTRRGGSSPSNNNNNNNKIANACPEEVAPTKPMSCP